MAWLPFDFRQNLGPRLLRIQWQIQKGAVGVIYCCDYYIGRFPPEYDNILLDTFIKGFVERKKEELRRERLTFEGANFRSADLYNDNPQVVVIGAKWYLDQIINVIEEMDRNNRIASPLAEYVPYKPDGNQELQELTESLSVQAKRDAIIRNLHVLQSIIKPIITAGNGAISNIEQIEAKVKELFANARENKENK